MYIVWNIPTYLSYCRFFLFENNFIYLQRNQSFYIMKRIPLKYNSEESETIIKMSSRCDKKGNTFFMVEYGNNEYVCFTHLSSALDFVLTNFRQLYEKSFFF